jgi:hypothetical protein
MKKILLLLIILFPTLVSADIGERTRYTPANQTGVRNSVGLELLSDNRKIIKDRRTEIAQKLSTKRIYFVDISEYLEWEQNQRKCAIGTFVENGVRKFVWGDVNVGRESLLWIVREIQDGC